MIPYATAAEAEAALGRAMTWPEAAWFRHSAAMPDYCLYYHTSSAYKLQPGVRRRTVADFIRCYKDAVSVLVLTVGGLQLVSYRIIKKLGIRTGLPLPSVEETVAQLLVYLLVEDYLTYWFHHQKASLAKMTDMAIYNDEKGREVALNSRKQDYIHT